MKLPQVQVRLSWTTFCLAYAAGGVIQPPDSGSTDSVTSAGFEPTTPWMSVVGLPNWATPPCLNECKIIKVQLFKVHGFVKQKKRKETFPEKLLDGMLIAYLIWVYFEVIGISTWTHTNTHTHVLHFITLLLLSFIAMYEYCVVRCYLRRRRRRRTRTTTTTTVTPKDETSISDYFIVPGVCILVFYCRDPDLPLGKGCRFRSSPVFQVWKFTTPGRQAEGAAVQLFALDG